MKNPVNLNGRHRSSLQGGEQDAPNGVAQRHAEAPLKRLGNHGRLMRRHHAGGNFKFLRLNKRLPVLLEDQGRGLSKNFFAATQRSINPAYAGSGQRDT